MNGKLIDIQKIWCQAQHNAFTDLIRFHDSWFCVFREGSDHISPDGRIRILRSVDGKNWQEGSVLSMPGLDLRDPKISVTPDGVLMINAAAAYELSSPIRHQSFVWFSENGIQWTFPEKIGPPNFWLWRITWHQNIAYSIGYSTTEPLVTRLYSSQDGITFGTLVDQFFLEDFPNEAALAFSDNGTAVCLLRRDRGRATAQLGLASFPFTDWSWKDLGLRIGGPQLLCLSDGRIVAAVRRYGKSPWTSLNRLDLEEGALSEFLALPSGGDNSYAGLNWHENILWVSYYSSHEGKASVYVARVMLSTYQSVH
jgi:hypothetical protein